MRPTHLGIRSYVGRRLHSALGEVRELAAGISEPGCPPSPVWPLYSNTNCSRVSIDFRDTLAMAMQNSEVPTTEDAQRGVKVSMVSSQSRDGVEVLQYV